MWWIAGVCMGVSWGAEATWVPPVASVEIVDDRVMGGRSRSRVEAAEWGLVYTGTLSRDGGGFTSMRLSPLDGLDLAEAEGIELVVRGDGRTYQLTARRADVPIRAGSYRARFLAPDAWTTVRLPFAAFGAMQMGEDLLGAPSLDAALAAVDQLGILLTDGPEGSFRLDVRSIATYGKTRGREGDPASVRAGLVSAIEEGVPAFNGGDPERCRAIYRTALREVVSRPELTDGEQALVRRALEEAEGLDPERAAWRLRFGIDAVLAGR